MSMTTGFRRAADDTYQLYLSRLTHGRGSHSDLLHDLQLSLDGILTASIWLSDYYKDTSQIERHNQKLIDKFQRIA